MATIRDGSAAVIVIDMQTGVLANAWDRAGVISRTSALIQRARGEAVPVIFVQHEDEEMAGGTESWQIVPELAPEEGEPVIAKHYPDSFEDTTLEATLAGLGVSHLVIAGAQTDACIRFTTQRALAEGYDMTLVGDCHTTDDREFPGISVLARDIIDHTNLVFSFVTYPNRATTVVAHDAIVFTSPVEA